MDMIDASTVGKWSMTEEKPRSTTPVQETPQKKISSSKFEKEMEKLQKLTEKLKEGIDKLYDEHATSELYSASVATYEIIRLLRNK
jgi:hypothetical protein